MHHLRQAPVFSLLLFAILSVFAWHAEAQDSSTGLSLATFDVDATPPIGSDLAYDPMLNDWDLHLRARGIVLLGAGDPIVLCAIDWIGIANEGNLAFRKTLAAAAGTTPDRVAVHTLHQHDAPACDFTSEAILKEHNLAPGRYEGTFARELLGRLDTAVRAALPAAQPVTQLGLGQAEVHEVASNRRIKGPDGKVRATRYTTCKDPDLRAEPEGVIDPIVSLVSFWNQDQPVAVLSYYACHPQSYYRTGIPNPDFPGLARFLRQLAVPGALHVHFNGAGGNLGAGKYNDGAHENRLILAERLADGMRRAWETTQRQPLTPEMVTWRALPVMLPPAAHLSLEQLEDAFKTPSPEAAEQATHLAWLRRCQNNDPINIACLTLGKARILHMPGELFVEYQLAAKAARPDLFVAMAAYGDYATGYIGTAAAYEEGGYETGPEASLVDPQVENVLLGTIKELLGKNE